MASANSENAVTKEILNRLTALDKKMDDNRKETAEFRQKTEGGFANLIEEMRGIGTMLYDKIESNHKEFSKFRQETFFFQKRTEDFQQQTLAFQEEMRIFKRQSLVFQDAMRETIQHFTRVLEKIGQDLSILREAYDQLKTEQEKFRLENEELKKAKVEHEATIKKLEQRIAILEVARNQPAL